MTTFTATETAKIVRRELKEAFPGTKFSVRTDSTGSLNITWTDGPAAADVDALVDQFEGQGFDGMTDMSYSRGTCYGTRFVFTRRNISDDVRAELTEEIAAELKKQFGIEDVREGFIYPVPAVIEHETSYPSCYGQGSMYEFVLALAEARAKANQH